MEFEVRHVAGIQDCFVSLSLFVIQTLQSTSSTLLPPLLTLELRSRAQDRPWVVAWSGATSSSTAIEVVQQFGECTSLPNHISVQVRVLSNVPKAMLVTIEPQTKDDWEVLELNPGHAEAAILKQLPLAGDVDLDNIANMTEGFSGADPDLQALLSDAQLATVHEHLNSKNSNETGKLPLITDALLKSTASKANTFSF